MRNHTIQDMPNLSRLVKDMEKQDWLITAFPFKYKDINYIVLVIRFEDGIMHSYNAIARFRFIKDPTGESLDAEAGPNALVKSAKELRAFFGIEYSSNPGDLFRQFRINLNRYIPPAMPQTELQPTQHISKIVQYLADKDGEGNPNKIYCYAVKRNGIDPITKKQKYRRSCNSDLARLLYPDLFQDFENDRTISFCFSDDPQRQRTRLEILESFAQRNPNLLE